MKDINLKEGLLKWRQSQIYVLAIKLRKKIMQEKHDVPMVVHCGEWTTRMAIEKMFYWPKMKEDVEHFVRTCKVPKLEVLLKNEIWTVQASIDIKWAMGECLNGLHDATPQMEWNGCHLSTNWSIFQIGKNGSNKDNRNYFWFNAVILWHVS